MTVSDRSVGSGRIVNATVDPVKVIVRPPSGNNYQFGALRSFFKALGPGAWHINIPAPMVREFLPDAVTG
jgi:hypothetical protein